MEESGKCPRDNFRLRNEQRETSSDTKNVNTDEQIRMHTKENIASSEVLALSLIVMLTAMGFFFCSSSTLPLFSVRKFTDL